MQVLARDRAGRIVASLVGIAIGLRALQVTANFRGSDGEFSAGLAQGTLVGFTVAIVAVAGLAAWRLSRAPDGAGGPRLAAAAGGMILGAVAGLFLFGAA